MRDNSVTMNFCCHTAVTLIIDRFSNGYTRNVTTWRRKYKLSGGVWARVLPTLLIVVFATISAPAGILILSADILIVFPNAIRIFWGYPYSLYAPLLRNVSALLLKFHNLHLPFILDSSPNCIGTFLTHKYLYNSEMSLKECLLWVNYDIFS